MLIDKFVDFKEITHNLNEMIGEARSIDRKLLLLNQTVEYLFSQVKLCETIEKAQDYFGILDQIQGTLATLYYEYKTILPDRLKRFMSDFDNFEQAKEYYFVKLKNGDYNF